MDRLVEELQRLHERAKSLMQGVEDGQISDDAAKAEYAAIKGHLAQRQKDFERRETALYQPWVVATFVSALRTAHIAMRSRTDANPRNDRWHSSVMDLCFELDYHLDAFGKRRSASEGVRR